MSWKAITITLDSNWTDGNVLDYGVSPLGYKYKSQVIGKPEPITDPEELSEWDEEYTHLDHTKETLIEYLERGGFYNYSRNTWTLDQENNSFIEVDIEYDEYTIELCVPSKGSTEEHMTYDSISLGKGKIKPSNEPSSENK